MTRDSLRTMLGAGRRPRPALPLVETRDGAREGDAPVALALGRAHEVCGPSAAIFAAMAAAGVARQAGPGPVLWIRAPRPEGAPNPDGLLPFLDPARLVLATPRRPDDALWCAEETLRTGAASLTVVELASAPGLTPVRRLHLAAEAGATLAAGQGAPPPLVLLLTPEPGGAQGVETRWRMAPAPSRPGPGARPQPCWRLELLRARMLRPRSWSVSWRGEAGEGALTLVPEPDPPPRRPPPRRRPARPPRAADAPS
ncbi:hypothetical protein P2H44_05015 [Albimonas sp. CAU 1670]|uniref:hypothetical protein n=1 Tax=Albimonas sp. CAU 1670 TaxID=3032599 RepID=UPI0023DC0033|nr:hypothetical protein [Albimonas sp. CAU 1670]MDF2231907.1 hypothetical protein [Albimonas sp. CAU 1670]